MAYRINENCVCCHYCRMECPVSAISYKGTRYAIDPEKCVSCGLCQTLCHVGAIINTEETAAVQPHEPALMQCDVVVVGSGGCGVTAAVRLAEGGKKVILVEAGKKLGGNTYLAHGAGFTGSKVQEKMGVPDESDRMLRRILSRSLWKVDPRKLEENVRASGGFFDWFAEQEGALEPFVYNEKGWMKFDYPYRRDHNLKCRDQAIGPGWMGSFFIDKLLKRGKQYDLTVLTGCRAKRLLTDGDRVTGIVCQDDGGEVRIESHDCVLATGGFLANREMMQAHFPWFYEGEEPVHQFNVPTNVGDGHLMVEQIGGQVDYDSVDVNLGGPAHHPYGYCAYRIMRQPEAVYVNMDGHRFMDETGGLNDGKYLLRKQPGAISYCVLDEGLLTELGQRLADNPPDVFDGWILKDFREEIEEEIAGGYASFKADTLEELAEKIGMPPKMLADEITKYNRFCQQGRDDDCYKDPKFLKPLGKGPYYAFYQKSFSEGTHGGIAIDADFRVLKANGSVIAGLWSGGDCARTDMSKGYGPVGLNGGLGGAFAGGYKIALNILQQSGK